MAEYTALAPLFTDIADAIRSKTGETGKIAANTFPDKINDITTRLDLTSYIRCNITVLSKWPSNAIIDKVSVTTEILILFWVKPNSTFFFYKITDFSADQTFQVFESDVWNIKVNFMTTYSTSAYYTYLQALNKTERQYREANNVIFFYR